MLRTENLIYKVGGKSIIAGITTQFLPASFNMILGPNGSGKSTFLKLFSGILPGYSGSVFYGNRNIKMNGFSSLAMHRAVLGQQTDLAFPLPVEEVVMMGRYPHFKIHPSEKDIAICGEAIDRLKLGEFRKRNYLTLSGGEKQRVQFARILSQVWERPTNGTFRYLFLDEPLNNLDIKYQYEFLQIVKSFCDSQTIVIAIIHDINLTMQFADTVFLMKEGTITISGSPDDTITEKTIADVFDIDTSIINNPATGHQIMTFR